MLFGDPAAVHRDAVKVVLNDVHHRQIPRGSHIDGLMEGALVGGAVTKEAQGYLVGTAVLGRITGAGGHWNPAAHNAVGAQNAQIHGHDVHGTALALGIARFLSQDLCHHAAHVGSPGHQMAVPTVGRGDVVPRLNGGAGAGGHSLLADI